MATASQLAAQGIQPAVSKSNYTTRKQWQALQDQFAGSQDGGGSLYNGPAPWQYPTDAAFRQAGYTDEWAASNPRGQDQNGYLDDPMLRWAEANGYDFGSADGHGAILDKSGNPLAKYGLQNDNTFWTGALAAGALVGGAASGAFGGGTGAASATGGAGAMTAEQVAMLAANGMTDAQIAAMAAAAGDTAMAASLTGAGMGGATSAATTATSGAWNGTDFSGAVQSAGNSNLGNALTTGAKAMGASDWIQLAGLGAGLIQSNNAQSSADAFAGQTAQQAADMLAFSKAQYADSLPFIKAAQEKSLQVSDAQLASMKQQDELSKEYADYNRTTFRPLEQGIVASAQGYDTPQKRQSAADQALADVDMQFSARNAATARQLAASGVAPGSAKSMAVLGSQGVEQARVGAGAAQMARKGVETTGFARQMDAASLGRNLPSAQATSAGLGIQAGNSAVNTSIAGANAGTQQAGLALNGMSSAANTNLAAGRLQQNAQDAQTQLWGQLGQAAGRWTATSDVNMKQDIAPADPEAALQQVTSTPVSNWKYSPAKMAAQGLPADGAQHTGPMAQDVNATMGEQAAPGGKKIDLVSMNGKTMLAVQALDRKINTLAQMLAGGRLQAGAAA